jgi:DNA-binding NarL/FixJ family response regulator
MRKGDSAQVTPPTTVKIAIADRDPDMRSRLCALLEQEPGIQIVAAGTDAAELVEQMRRNQPDLLVLDVRDPPITGIETIVDAMREKALCGADGAHDDEGHGRNGAGAAETAGLAGPRPGHVLTPREREIMGLIAEGLSNHQIAAHLVISPKTVKNHIRGAYHRMGVHGRRQAVRHWWRNGPDRQTQVIGRFPQAYS